jgi:hypothetical protein
MFKITEKQLYLFLSLLDDEVERHRVWLQDKDYVCPVERELLISELTKLKNTIDELSQRTKNKLTLVE